MDHSDLDSGCFSHCKAHDSRGETELPGKTMGVILGLNDEGSEIRILLLLGPLPNDRSGLKTLKENRLKQALMNHNDHSILTFK